MGIASFFKFPIMLADIHIIARIKDLQVRSYDFESLSPLRRELTFKKNELIHKQFEVAVMELELMLQEKDYVMYNGEKYIVTDLGSGKTIKTIN